MELLGPWPIDVKGICLPRSGDHTRVASESGVAARVEYLTHRVAEGQDHHPPVLEGVVERQNRRLLSAVRRHRRGERRSDAVRQFALLHKSPA